jgi:hypothetical protein
MNKKSTKYHGVYYNSNKNIKSNKRWYAKYRIPNKDKEILLGFFHTEIDAAKAYDTYLLLINSDLERNIYKPTI